MTTRPTVIRRSGKQTAGKGFSTEELKKSGLSMTEAVKLRIPVDPRRRTAHDENIESLKAVVKEKKAAIKPKPKPKPKPKETKGKPKS